MNDADELHAQYNDLYADFLVLEAKVDELERDLYAAREENEQLKKLIDQASYSLSCA